MATPGRAAFVTVVCVFALFAAQFVFALGGLGLLPAMLAGYLAFSIGFLRIARVRGLDIGLRRPRWRFIVAACLIGVSAWFLGLTLVVLVKVPEHDAIGPVLRHGSLPMVLVVIVALAAFAEELVFRGVLARGLASRWPAWAAVVVSAVAFSAFHVIPAQMLGVFPLALALGVLAVRSGSALPGMLAHALNNTIALAMIENAFPDASAVLASHGLLALVGACVVFALGVTLCLRGSA